jgi:hypothetical protein
VDRVTRAGRDVVCVSLVLGLVLCASASAARAQDVAGAEPATSDFVAPVGGLARLELVAMDDANGLTDLAVDPEGAHRLLCRLPCTVEVPRGAIRLLAEGLDQRFVLDLPAARFALRAAEPVPWLESIGGYVAGLALGSVGMYAALTSSETDEVVGGAALVALGGALVVLVTVVLVIGALDHGSAELQSFEEALRDGTVARF